MRIYGEEYFLINGWMNFLSLLLAARLARLRFSPGRGAAAALIGAGYAVAAWAGGPLWRGVAALLLSALLMAALAFGRRALRALPLVLAAGLLLSGCAALLIKKGAGTGITLFLCGCASALCCWALSRGVAQGGGVFRLRIDWAGKSLTLPALRDSGNLLRDGVSGLPVIVAPAGALRPLLPQGVNTADLSTLPRGWYLVRVRTAGGSRVLMCFHPESLALTREKKQWRVDAAVALSDFPEKRALLPEALFIQKEEEESASL